MRASVNSKVHQQHMTHSFSQLGTIVCGQTSSDPVIALYRLYRSFRAR